MRTDRDVMPAIRQLAVGSATVLLASCSTHRNDAPQEGFAVVDGVRLHNVDCGGARRGECLLFLTPLGGDLLEQFGSLDRSSLIGFA